MHVPALNGLQSRWRQGPDSRAKPLRVAKIQHSRMRCQWGLLKQSSGKRAQDVESEVVSVSSCHT